MWSLVKKNERAQLSCILIFLRYLLSNKVYNLLQGDSLQTRTWWFINSKTGKGQRAKDYNQWPLWSKLGKGILHENRQNIGEYISNSFLATSDFFAVTNMKKREKEELRSKILIIKIWKWIQIMDNWIRLMLL